MILMTFCRRLMLGVFLLCALNAHAGNIDPGGAGEKFVYGENAGWINFNPSLGQGVTVTETGLTGFAWGENIGWIKLNPAAGGVVNDGQGNLSGFAWSENLGWINFAPPGGGVHIDACGDFNGMAWGENIGWISFRSDGAVPFRLRTAWTSPLDAIAPVTVPASTIQDWYNLDIDINITTTDCGSGVREVRYSLNNGTEVVSPGSTATISFTADGIYSLSYYSVDNSGNMETQNIATVRIDKTPPDIIFQAPQTVAPTIQTISSQRPSAQRIQAPASQP